jgi:ABC-type molybdate transport system substrate-binding protein
MDMRSIVKRTTLGVALSLALGAGAQAAEIKVLASNGVKTVLEELAPQFEKSTGLPVAGAELAGPLPPGIQIYSVFPAAVGTGAKDPAAAQAFIKALTAPAAAPVIRAKGMEPG